MAKCDIYPHIRNQEGEWVESRLFRDLLDKGLSRAQAANVYRHVHSESYLKSNGDWISNPDAFTGQLDSNSEPTIDTVLNGLPEIPEDVPKVQYGAIDPSTQSKLSYMADRMEGVSVITSSEVEGVADVGADQDGNPQIRINPENIQSDTVFHEYGHIFIDALGYSNHLVQRGIEQVKGTNLWKRVQMVYPDLSGQDLEKEALATALGSRADEIFSSESDKSSWRKWLEALGRRFRQLLGIDQDVITSLSRDLLQGRVDPLTATFENLVEYEQRDFSGLQSERTEIFKESMRVIQRFIDQFSSITEEQRSDRVDRLLEELRNKKEVFASKNEKINQEDIPSHIAKKEMVESIMAFSNFAMRHIETISEDFEQRKQAALSSLNSGLEEETDVEPLSMGELDRIFKSAQGYGIVEDIIDLIERDSEMQEFITSSGVNLEEMLSDLREVDGRIRRIKRRYKDISQRFLTERLLPFEREVEAKYRNQFQEEYDELESPDQTRAQYVSRQMEANRSQINAERRDSIREQLSFMEEDISTFQRWMYGVQHVDDGLLRIVKSMIDRVNKQIRNDFLELEEEMRQAYEELYEYKGRPSNPIEVYDDILETDENGNYTGFLISRYTSDYIEDFEQVWEEYHEIKEEQGKAAAVQHLEENAPYDTVTGEGNYIRIPHDEYLNPEWRAIQQMDDDNPIKKFYDLATEKIDRFDRNRPSYKRLGMDTDSGKIYELPHMRKSTVERFTDGNFSIDQLKDMWRDATEIVEDDEIFGSKETRIGVDGKKRDQVPIFFSPQYDGRGVDRERKISMNNQSLDVTNLLLSNGHTSLNYEYKSKLLPTIDALEYHMSERDVQERGGFGKALMHTFNMGGQQIEDKSTLDPQATNSYELWRGMIEGDIFGEFQKRGRFTQLMNTLMSAVGINFLGFNVIAGTANFIKGNIEFTLEALGGNTFSMDQWRTAHAKYMRDVKNLSVIRDVGINQRTSKTNQLSERFNALNDFRGSDFNFSENNAFKRLMNQSTIYFIHNAGEHMVQHLTMYGVLDSVNVTNEDGEYLNEDFEVVSSKDEAMTLEEAFSVGEEGAQLDERLTHVEFDGRIREYNDDLEFDIERKIWDINEHLHGAYSHQNRADAQRYVIGRMAFMMRKWMLPNMRQRVGKSYSNLWDALTDGDTALEFNEQKGEWEEGYYVTTARFIGNVARDLKNFNLKFWRHFDDMTKKEIRNMQRALGEVGFLSAAWAFANIFQGLAEAEDDDQVIQNMYFQGAYQANRIMSELQFFYNPNEALRLVQDPLATTAFVNDIGQLIAQITTAPFERYERGRRAGELKVWKDLVEVLPVIRQYENIKNIDETITFFN